MMRKSEEGRLIAVLLAAGYGSRLGPITRVWPKCLMPLAGRPLLDFWMETCSYLNAYLTIINTHYMAEKVSNYVQAMHGEMRVHISYEQNLIGTAGTLRENYKMIKGCTVLVAHADNFCQCDFESFLHYHSYSRPSDCCVTMMTFDSTNPSSCGIVGLDDRGVVQSFHEKPPCPPSNVANGAVYIFSSEVIDWIVDNPTVNDISTEVIPQFLGRIATWHNDQVHVDIGTIESLCFAQSLAQSRSISSFGCSNDQSSVEFVRGGYYKFHADNLRGERSWSLELEQSGVEEIIASEIYKIKRRNS